MTDHKYFEFHQKLFSSVEDFGFELVKYTEEPRAFDNFYAVFSNKKIEFQIIRDRSHYHIADDLEGMEQCGLNKAFKDRGAFQQAIALWLRKIA